MANLTSDPDVLSKQCFVIILLGVLAYGAAVVIFVL